MKYFLLAILLISVHLPAKAQTLKFLIKIRGKDTTLIEVPKVGPGMTYKGRDLPYFPEGLGAYMRSNRRLAIKDKRLKGRVVLQFTIDDKGKVINTGIVKHAGPALDNEALRLLRDMPAWQPAEEQGDVINWAVFTVAVDF